jgi:Ca2+:H+ antiporter
VIVPNPLKVLAVETRTSRLMIIGLPAWAVVVPIAAVAALAAAYGRTLGPMLLLAVVAALFAAVLVAVHHAEVIAHRIGEPFGTLVLALAVTVIETSLIISIMLAASADAEVLARDTVVATVMIVCNGVIGLCLLAGALRHHVVSFRSEGAVPAVAVLATLCTFTLILPNFTRATPGPTLSTEQLVFDGIVSLVLYGCFVFVQTVRHRDYFLPEGHDTDEEHAGPPATVTALASLVLLLVSLVAVVGLAKTLAPSIEAAVVGAGMPRAVVGIAIALLVLLPETLSALRAARRGRIQSSLNLALGSGLATIGLTIPAVVVAAIALGLPLELGVPPTELVLLALTLLLTSMTMAAGKATVLQGAVHLIVFAAYLFLAMVP